MKGRYNSRSDLRNYREEQQKSDRVLNMIRNLCTAVIVMCIATLLLLCMSSCTTTRYVTVETVMHDTTYIAKIQKDSIWMHDSICIKERGNSVFVDRWHTKYVDRLRIDTLYQSKTDSIPVPYPVERLVPKQLSWWQKTQMIAGDVLLAVLFGLLCFGCWKLIRKFGLFI